MANSVIPTIDLSPFFTDGNKVDRKKAKEIISQACSEYGFFQIVNHGVPLGLMSRAMELSQKFFAYPLEEKLKSLPMPDSPLPLGYSNTTGKKEDIFMSAPGTSFNVLPSNPPEFKEVMEEFFTCFAKTGLLVESILNDCLGLPPNFLKDYNADRSGDLMLILSYPPLKLTDDIGLVEHQDGNCITFVLQDEVGGLEVQKNGEWIRVNPSEGTLVVNIGDVLQVLSNNKFKSAIHRVVSSKERRRRSFAFFYGVEGDKWVEPLPQFSKDIGELPLYRGFHYKEYHALRVGQKINPPSKEDRIGITHFAISTLQR